MLNHISEMIVFVLFLPVVMHIILPLGMLAGWLVWRGLNLFVGEKNLGTESAIRHAS